MLMFCCYVFGVTTLSVFVKDSVSERVPAMDSRTEQRLTLEEEIWG